MVAMGLLSRRSGLLVLCGRTEARRCRRVHDWLADKLARRGRQGERVSERLETDASLAERMVREALAKARWREIDLATQPKGHRLKVRIAQQLRRQTPMSRQWIADWLRMGSASYISNLLGTVESEL